MASKSRFFAGSSSDDSSNSDSDSDRSSSEEEDTQKTAQADGATKSAAKWAIDSDSDSDDEGRVVKSEKDKRLDNIKDACNVLRNKVKINDWSGTQAQFLVLQKAMDSAELVIKEHGVPRFYLSVLCFLQDAVTAILADKPRFKKLSKANSKAVNRMKFHFKKTKHIVDYLPQMEEYRAAPEAGVPDERADLPPEFRKATDHPMLTTVLLKLKRDELLTVLQSGGMRLVGNEKQRLKVKPENLSTKPGGKKGKN